MATTSLWPVKGSVRKVIEYATNEAKTTLEDASGEVRGGLEEVLRYSMQDAKTDGRSLVAGINCLPETAAEEMRDTKRQYGKTGGTVAFHGYQSFAPGETDSLTAHQIGVALASELWGGRFEVVVATHLDRGHIHNHFVINSVSYADGRRFHRDAKCYRAMREASDRLCAERGLSVIEDPSRGASKHYAEWSAEKAGQTTWRGLVKADVDEAIARAATERQFWANLAAIGYEIKRGKDISVRPPGKERFVRLARNFGAAYTHESIKRRILENRIPARPVKRRRAESRPLPPVPKGSIVALYRQWLYLLGGYGQSASRPHFLLREDIRHMERISHECALLADNSIETIDDLGIFERSVEGRIAALVEERKAAKRDGGTTGSDDQGRLAEISAELKKLRKEVKMCESIRERSGLLPERIAAAGARENPERERSETDGSRGPGGGTGRKDNSGGQRDARPAHRGRG